MGGGRERLFIFSTFLVLVLVLVAFWHQKSQSREYLLNHIIFHLGEDFPAGM